LTISKDSYKILIRIPILAIAILLTSIIFYFANKLVIHSDFEIVKKHYYSFSVDFEESILSMGTFLPLIYLMYIALLIAKSTFKNAGVEKMVVRLKLSVISYLILMGFIFFVTGGFYYWFADHYFPLDTFIILSTLFLGTIACVLLEFFFKV
jgi:hypothetical protein